MLLILIFHMKMAVVIEASLSYLGFGVQEPQASFGNMLASHFELYLRGQWQIMLLIVDGLYSIDRVQEWLIEYLPELAGAYQPVHDNFLLIDLCFVKLFLSEFVVRWVVSVRQKTYLRWYFYPFIHWYDLVGCIPLGATRVFRFLRVFSIIYRLQKFGVIDLRQTGLYRFVSFYYEVFLEELTDRVILKSLSDVQGELEGNSQIVEEILQRVVYTRKETLASWVSLSMAHVGNSIERNKEGIVTQHLIDSVSEAMSSNQEVARLRSIPVIGKTLEGRLERGVADIVVSTIVNLLNEMSAEKMLSLLEKTSLIERPSMSHLKRARSTERCAVCSTTASKLLRSMSVGKNGKRYWMTISQ